MKIASIVGARPQFIKASPLSRALTQHHTEILIHTGQHYDANLSEIFFRELELPAPNYNLGVGSGSHGAQTAAILAGIEAILQAEQPDWVIIYGDTNSTLAGSLAAAKLGIPIAHIEAGLRSYNRAMPEEINRLVSDHLASLLLCPSDLAVANLAAEGITQSVYNVGDVMADALSYATARNLHRPSILEHLGLEEKRYLLATLHRAENTDDPQRLTGIVSALEQLEAPVILPLHPRTRQALAQLGRSQAQGSLRYIEPVGYLDMIQLETSARIILTDSGGIQKEAYWLGVPCITLREETEWPETVDSGWNLLVGAQTGKIMQAVKGFTPPDEHPALYGDGKTAPRCVRLIEEMENLKK